MTEPCPRCNMTWGDPHNCHPPAQLVAAEARLAALVTAGDAMAEAVAAIDSALGWGHRELFGTELKVETEAGMALGAWRAARKEGG